ncbi:arginase family protein [Paracoccus versutus]|uniref:Arginase/N-omega-hydroxy-L-arginine amidinohydrolase n=1 Tax=Paracoccus versutus TaxID=34007 RepID=A0AAQ0HEL1_PARVE|nr:arginase family protein [Paracoccus versutus]KGJ08947.1 arginase [Paracoccus versutus]REG35253.1 arginase/N-omega-hydroxy-L-arginine amidinohydrolase [Paracoccus versutus]WEJ77405.1 arginase family protein [Paracoccus versutus]
MRPASGILLSQGRLADRTPGAIPGAKAVAEALAAQTGLSVQSVGTPAPAAEDGWQDALREAGPWLGQLADAVRHRIEAGERPLVVANTCSASIATLPAAARMIDGLNVLWVDAHGDFNTPATTETGYLGGMALAGACGLWRTGHGGEVSPARVALLAARDIDPPEEALLAQAGVRRFAAGAEPETVLAALGEGPIWLHVDWDAMEPGTVPAAYSVPGGLVPDRLRAFLAAIPPERIAGVELAEFEMPGTAQAAQGAIATILDIVGPLLPPER